MLPFRLPREGLRCAPPFLFSMPAALPSPKRKRGRPAARWLTLDEVAEITGCDAGVLARLLDKVPGTIPGADRDVDGWKVPERGLRAILGAPTGPLPQWATVQEVAAAVRRSEKTVYWWLGLKRDDRTPLLPHTKVLGTVLILARDVLALPAVMPAAGRAPSFLFSEATPNAGGGE